MLLSTNIISALVFHHSTLLTVDELVEYLKKMFLEQVQKWISSFQSFHTFQVSQALIYDMNNEPDRTSRACTPVLQNLRLFAIETIETIETMIEISEKCAEPTSPFCATLRSALWDIKTELQEHRQYYDETESGKVEILLDSLEELCGVCLRSIRFS